MIRPLQTKLTVRKVDNKVKCRLKSFGAAWVSVVFFALAVCGQPGDRRVLTLDRIFSSNEFRSETFGPARWLDDGSAYTTLEPSPTNKEVRDIIRYEAATGARSVLIAAASLTPKGAPAPLEIDDYAWSKDGHKLLVFTNTKQVWRQNT